MISYTLAITSGNENLGMDAAVHQAPSTKHMLVMLQHSKHHMQTLVHQTSFKLQTTMVRDQPAAWSIHMTLCAAECSKLHEQDDQRS
jgi:hypothetical protein